MTVKYFCCTCGKTKKESDFYKSNSDFNYNSALPICKNCFAIKFDQYTIEYRNVKKAMQRLCIAFDIYFNEELFDKCDIEDSTGVGLYFRKLNIVQYKNKTFDTVIDEGKFTLSGDRKTTSKGRVAVVDEYDNVIENDTNKKIKTSNVEKWGVGFSIEDYDVLESHYKYLKKANPDCDSNQEIFIMDLCYIKMQQMKALREDRVDDFNKLTESYRKSFSQGGLKVVRESVGKEEFGLGVTINMIEKYTPAEFYKNQELYKDFNKRGDYITRFMLRPLKNLMHGTTDRDYEFCVKDEDDI